MTSLTDFQKEIDALAKAKGWQDDLAWLGLGVFKEFGELWQAYEHGESELAIGKEFSGVMHYLLQVMTKVAPNIDLDAVLKAEIETNKVTKKKTYEGGKIVRK